MLQEMVSVFSIGCEAFYESAESVPISPGPGKRGEENQEPVYRNSVIPCCQSCIPAGIFATYMTDWDIESSMEFPDFLLHTFILHKPLIFTTSLKRFVIRSRYSFYAENFALSQMASGAEGKNAAQIPSTERSSASAVRSGLRKKFKIFSPGGSKNQTFCDVSSRGMKRPHEMINPIFKCLFSHPR